MSNSQVARFRFKGDHVHEFTLPEQGDPSMPPVYIFGIKKGGSTLLSKLVREISELSSYSYFELPRECFLSGLPMFRLIEDVDQALTRPGYVFGTFRWFPENDFLAMPHQSTKILLVRDPRDVMVSLYYSDKGSHALPPEGPLRESMEKRREYLQNVDIDTYVMDESSAILRHYLRTLQLSAMPNTIVLRYRDIIYDKLHLAQVVAKALGMPTEDPRLEEIARRHDVIPGKEKEQSHIRQVHPGNYKNKLSDETIRALNYRFRLIIKGFRFHEDIEEPVSI